MPAPLLGPLERADRLAASGHVTLQREVAAIGREGMLGMSAALTRDPSPSATMVQAETDTCYTMSAAAFRKEMDRRGAFYDLLTRYGQALVGFIMQSTACNAVHPVSSWFDSRWRLTAVPRADWIHGDRTTEGRAMDMELYRRTPSDRSIN
jgi:hypothetical protein